MIAVMSTPLPALLSVVVVLRNESGSLARRLAALSGILAALVTDHELIVVDNGSSDDSVAQLRVLAAGGLPNLQVYCLTKEVDFDTACWAGIENALGDYVAAVDLLREDPAFLRQMLETAMLGDDVVFAENLHHTGHSLLRRAAVAGFHATYRYLNGVHLGRDAPRFRLLSRTAVNFLMRHPAPSLSYRHLPATAGFIRAKMTYRAAPTGARRTSWLSDLDRAARLLVFSKRAPMRIVTMLSLFGAVANLVYSAYVIAVAVLKSDVAPGWITLSLQQSGMYFLFSLVLLVLGEYILHMSALSSEGPRYHVAQEFTSSEQTRRRRLNVEESTVVPLHGTRDTADTAVSAWAEA
jgi:polyisoprenyl-phosphate glycosyltransferase